MTVHGGFLRGKQAAGPHLQDVDKPGVEHGAHAFDVLVDEHRGSAIGALREHDVIVLQPQLPQCLLVVVRPVDHLRGRSSLCHGHGEPQARAV